MLFNPVSGSFSKESLMKYIGIDGGVSGAIAVLSEKGKLLKLYDMPTKIKITGRKRDLKTGKMFDKTKRVYDIPMIAIILKQECNEGAFVVLEQAQSMPDQGVASMFSTGFCFGVMQGILTALCIQYVIVPSQRWKQQFELKGTEKEAAIPAALKFFPEGVFVTPRGRMIDGRADAALLAIYGRNFNEGITTQPADTDSEMPF
jgi:hypothetical protein